MYEALIATRVPVKLHMFDGVDHMFDRGKPHRPLRIVD
ncbi:MAG TPA: hypothetical protein DEV93_10565 [Chloroflexi bacterium]|nr:hypothetical protein [Chloroflexota bacterium]